VESLAQKVFCDQKKGALGRSRFFIGYLASAAIRGFEK
jgi:hypothetical protein